MNKKVITPILVVFLALPLLVFLLRPEINAKNKYIKFSWAGSVNDVKEAFRKKNPGEIFKKIYDRSGVISVEGNFSSGIKKTISSYITYSRYKMDLFIKKWNKFIT
jgi:hypothetical protein